MLWFKPVHVKTLVAQEQPIDGFIEDSALAI